MMVYTTRKVPCRKGGGEETPLAVMASLWHGPAFAVTSLRTGGCLAGRSKKVRKSTNEATKCFRSDASVQKLDTFSCGRRRHAGSRFAGPGRTCARKHHDGLGFDRNAVSHEKKVPISTNEAIRWFRISTSVQNLDTTRKAALAAGATVFQNAENLIMLLRINKISSEANQKKPNGRKHHGAAPFPARALLPASPGMPESCHGSRAGRRSQNDGF